MYEYTPVSSKPFTFLFGTTSISYLSPTQYESYNIDFSKEFKHQVFFSFFRKDWKLIFQPCQSPSRNSPRFHPLKAFTLSRSNPLVRRSSLREFPKKACPVRTVIFVRPQKDRLLSETKIRGVDDRIKIHSMPPSAGGHKSYSPTNLSRPCEIDKTVKSYPDGVHSQALESWDTRDSIRAGTSPTVSLEAGEFCGRWGGTHRNHRGRSCRAPTGRCQTSHPPPCQSLRGENAFFKSVIERLPADHPGGFSGVYLYSREETKSCRVSAHVLHKKTMVWQLYSKTRHAVVV